MTVLDKFSVTNRKNMFVIKETNGEVFYLRLVHGMRLVYGKLIQEWINYQTFHEYFLRYHMKKKVHYFDFDILSKFDH